VRSIFAERSSWGASVVAEATVREIGRVSYESIRHLFLELALGAVRAVDDDLRRLIEVVTAEIDTPALLVGQPAGLAVWPQPEALEPLQVEPSITETVSSLVLVT
jgi:hypothetical protein